MQPAFCRPFVEVSTDKVAFDDVAVGLGAGLAAVWDCVIRIAADVPSDNNPAERSRVLSGGTRSDRARRA